MKDNKSSYDSGIYDANITNVLPYYTEFHSQVIDVAKMISRGREKGIKWLDTGCGTGTLAARALAELPDTEITLCDPSEGMLKIAKEKLKGKNISFNNIASDALAYENEFDIVTAIQSHHYYDIETRSIAVKKCCRALKEEGIFMTFENIRMSTKESDAMALDRWGQFLLDHGWTPEKVKAHQARRGVEMFPITIEQHLEMIKNAGFRSVNILWASYMQAGFWAVK
ncbi:MAG: class I SAM-dependent methyltransferase [Lachnospiraceae bacterium]|nr:class I SAM-dependent methyltransferase [Lachnospiraceae bacterium]